MPNRLKIYLASSWRNISQGDMVRTLRLAGHEVYDFKNPRPGDNGFGWREVDPDWQRWTPSVFREGLTHPVACAGFKSDFDAMKWADACVLLLPCGRSAHIEAGYFVGANKPLYIVLAPDNEPELMYLMANGIFVNPGELLNEIGEF